MRPESAALLEKARRSLDAARRLLEAGHPDFAADRAYYAIFYAAEALLAARDLRYSSHGAVHGAFGREFARTEELDPAFHRWLLNAFDLRQDAVYRTDRTPNRDDVEEVLSRGGAFVDSAEEYLRTRSGE